MFWHKANGGDDMVLVPELPLGPRCGDRGIGPDLSGVGRRHVRGSPDFGRVGRLVLHHVYGPERSHGRFGDNVWVGHVQTRFRGWRRACG